MTFATHDTVLSLYPLAMFGLDLNFANYDEHPTAREGRQKYQDQGWTTVGPECVHPNATMHSIKCYVGDRFCWSVSLRSGDDDMIDRSINVHSWTLLYPSLENGWVTQYAILSFPGPSPGICVSRSIIVDFNTVVSKWTYITDDSKVIFIEDFAKFVRRTLLGTSHADET
ncbi:hypothetical protein EDD18DRAFT_1352809 [Armillaria luteobubalina]|uniref:Uncharacterized protein n=1 Tax=Armillaria luteobubalina TaxID=153913 RepID=A0AA39Q7D1_9AGAR|nr:hypothetical protein EDD18DRAFT_1352809 [Armillaria luteobubalina]